MVQEYLNEISPTIYGPNKPKTSGKPLKIPDLQTPAANHYKPATLYYILHLHIFRWTICWVLNALAESQDVYTFWHFWPPKILLIMDLNSCARQMWRRKRLQCQVKLNFQYQFNLHIIILLIYKLAESDRANLANVNISNIFWNLMENAERRKVSQTGNKRKPSLVEF